MPSFQRPLTKLMATANAGDATDMMYFYSCIEEQTGKAENAKRNYKNLLETGDSGRWSFILLCDRLHELGINDTPLPHVNAKPN
jgi:hypothetical protein